MTLVFAAGKDGTYLGSLDGVALPAGAVAVALPPSDGRQLWNGTAWVWPEKPIDEARAERLAELTADYNAAADLFTQSYPERETMTWTTQAREARLYEAWVVAGSVGTPPATPNLSACFAERQLAQLDGSFAELVQKVIGKDAPYSAAMGALTGRRHVAEAQLLAATTTQAVKAVAWDFSFT